MPQANLELTLHRRDAGLYTIDLRYFKLNQRGLQPGKRPRVLRRRCAA